MRLLPILFALCLSGCATSLTLISPPIRAELLVTCGDKIADPLTTGDQYDTSRALVQATRYARECATRQRILVDAVQIREQMMQSIKQQLEK